MNNKFVHSKDSRRYSEVIKPLYKEIANMPLSLTNIGYSKIYKKYNSPLFNYGGFVIMYVYSGQGKLILKNETILLNKSDLICYIPGGFPPIFIPISDNWEYKWIDFY